MDEWACRNIIAGCVGNCFVLFACPSTGCTSILKRELRIARILRLFLQVFASGAEISVFDEERTCCPVTRKSIDRESKGFSFNVLIQVFIYLLLLVGHLCMNTETALSVMRRLKQSVKTVEFVVNSFVANVFRGFCIYPEYSRTRAS